MCMSITLTVHGQLYAKFKKDNPKAYHEILEINNMMELTESSFSMVMQYTQTFNKIQKQTISMVHVTDVWDCYDRYFSFNRLNTFSWIHLILSWHVIILSQGTLSLYLFSHEISISPMLPQPSFNFHAVHGYACFSSLPFWYLMHHTCYASKHSLLNFRTHSPGLRVCLMHTVSVDPIQSCTNSMSSI